MSPWNSEWHAAQALRNPWVTPYWLLRHCCRPTPWNYWDVGLKRSFGILDDLFFTVDFFGELGDAHHFAAQYGPNHGEAGSRYHGGLQALNLVPKNAAGTAAGFVGLFG